MTTTSSISKRHGDSFITKVDRNGSKHWTDNNCTKCGGTGYIAGYEFIDGARCWKCGATGFYPHHWIERTPEYQAILNAKRDAKNKEKNLAKREEFFESEGFDKFGVTYVAIGDTYSIKDELKTKGFKFNHFLGWHIPYMVGDVPCIEIGYELIMWENNLGKLFYRDNAKELVDGKRPTIKSQSGFIGKAGDKIRVELVLKHCYTVEGRFGIIHVNKFKDRYDNIFIWKTNRQIIGINDKVILIGTIKEHNEFRGEKQTILTRCKEVA